MSQLAVIPEGETGFDRVLGFTLPDRDARGRIVRLGPALDTVMSAHDYPTAIRQLLAEALVIAALVGSLLKDRDSQLTIQAQADDGIVQLLACDYRNGEVRGYVNHRQDRLEACQGFPTLGDLFGSAYLAITFDLAATKQRYQGIVPMVGESLSEACQGYFVQSEQVPTLIRTKVRWVGGQCIASGLLVQHLSEGEEGRVRLHVRLDHPEWEHVAVLAGSVKPTELLDPALSLEALIWRLYHEEREIRVEQLAPIVRGCRCSAAYYKSVLMRFPENERVEMRGDDGVVSVDCAFCSKIFKIAV